jgi:hypothetical protein
VDSALLSISHFSLHSLGVILGRRRRTATLDQLVHDLFEQGQVVLRTVPPGEFPAVSAAMQTRSSTSTTPTSTSSPNVIT